MADPSLSDNLERGRSWLTAASRPGLAEASRPLQESPEKIVRCIDIDRLCEEERIRRLGERIRRDRDEACELSRERRARGLSRELLAAGFGVDINVADPDVGSNAPSDKPQPASRVLQLQRTQQQDEPTTEPQLVVPPAPDVQNAHVALASTAPVTKPGPTPTFGASAGFGVSWAAALAEENFGMAEPPNASSASNAIVKTVPTTGGYAEGSVGAPTTSASSSFAGSPKVSAPASHLRNAPLAKSKSPSAATRLRKAQATPPRHLSPAPMQIATPLRPEEVEEQQRILKETQREMREIKALESQIGWEMHREEKAQVVNEKKEADLEIMEWRNQLASGLKEIAEAKSYEQKIEDLGASKEYQEFKREAKQVEKEHDLQLVKEQLQADIEFAQMQAEIAKTAALDRHAMNLEHLEDIQVVRENKTQQRIQEKAAVEQERAIEQRLNFNHQASQLRSQKEELLRNLQMMRSVQKQPVCTSGRAGRPRAAKGGN